MRKMTKVKITTLTPSQLREVWDWCSSVKLDEWLEDNSAEPWFEDAKAFEVRSDGLVLGLFSDVDVVMRRVLNEDVMIEDFLDNGTDFNVAAEKFGWTVEGLDL
jgi:hypothetical protein